MAAKDGFSKTQISKIFNIPLIIIVRSLKSNNIEARKLPVRETRELKLSDEDIIKIFELRNAGKTYDQIGESVGISREFVRRITENLAYKTVIEKYNLKVEK